MRVALFLHWRCCTSLIRLCFIHIFILSFSGFLFHDDHSHPHLIPQLASVADAAASSSFLPLPVGFNTSIFAQLNNLVQTYNFLVPTVGQAGYFLPFLSSPSFNTTWGFSLGFFFSFDKYISFDEYYNIYLAVCAGTLGNYSAADYLQDVGPLYGQDDFGHVNQVEWPSLPDDATSGSIAVTVLLMNPATPLRSLFNSTLSVVAVQLDAHTNTSTTELQLRNHDGSVAWRVANVGMMEMQDAGELLIYNSTSLPNHVVWRSSEDLPVRDTLLQWQKLKPGMQLHSSNSAYMARMEAGGLVLYLRNTPFITQSQQPAPYWILPLLFPDSKIGTFANLNSMLLSSPCMSTGNDDERTAYSRLGNSTRNFYLHAGSCTPGLVYCINVHMDNYDPDMDDKTSSIDFMKETSTSTNTPLPGPGPGPGPGAWSFLRLEDDGRLHVYNVVTRPSLSVQQYAAGANDASYVSSDYRDRASAQVPALAWAKCDVPMACGPLGLCTPGIQNLCTCPQSLDPRNSTDLLQGCRRKASNMLPLCDQKGTKQNVTPIFQYMQLNNTAAIFLFSGWEFESTSNTSVEICKKLCSSNCSCTGFFHQVDVSACFFMTDEISLLNLVHDNTLTSPLYSKYIKEKMHSSYTIIKASNYATYIKVSLVDTSTAHHRYIMQIAIIASGLSLTLLGVVANCICRWARQVKHSKQARAKEEEELQGVLPLLPSRFTYKELSEATDNFGTLLGEGGCGSVYGGTLPGGRNVAVKILELSDLKGVQTKQFLAELATIGSTSHQHIVHLVGFCWDAMHRLLVYEYVERGSLDRWLFMTTGAGPASRDINIEKGKMINSKAGPSACDTPSAVPPELFHEWRTRYDIACGIARGLSYLHEECSQPILHFDIKPQNILLDDAFVPKLADFGMSRFIQRDVSKVVTGWRGTPGYMAPEWMSSGAVGKKSDVYSMGMVMLEIVGGRRNFDLEMLGREELGTADGQLQAVQEVEEGAWHFPRWAAKKCDEGLMMEVLDKRLRNVDMEQVQTLIFTAFWCIVEDPKMRPSATMVVQWLEGNNSPILQRPPWSGIIRASSTTSSSSFVSSSL